MQKFLSKLISVIKWIWQRPETKEALTALQAKVWADLKDIAYQAIAEAKAGNITSGEDKRRQAFDRISTYAKSKGMHYPESIINWLIEHAYARFI